MTTDTVAVLGFGTMGGRIVDACAQAGLEVIVLEVDEERLTGLPAGVAGTTDVGDLAGVGLVIETVPEDEALKATLLREVADVVGPDAILATSTSGLSVTRLAAALPRPERIGGLHFVNPAALLPLVEVVRALETSDTTVAALVAFAERVGKHPIVVQDRPGFLVNALLLPYLNHAIREYDEGLAGPADLDRAVELGLGYPNGPLRMLDLIGLDTHLATTEAIYAATRDARFAPPPLLGQMVAAGRLGRKAGRGFVTDGDAS